MLGVDRENRIIEMLKENGSVKLKNIIDLLGISEATARRDLENLEKKEILIRVHGGAVLNDNLNHKRDLNIQYRKSMNTEEKDRIAKLASSFIKDNSCIYIDAGTTTLEMIKYIKGKNVKIVTNSLSIIQELEKYEFESYLIGGKLKSKTSCTIGFSAVHHLKLFNFNQVFIGANAINKNGYSTPDSEEALVKEMAIEQGEEIYFLCDSSKIGKSSVINFSTLDRGILITDKEIKEEYIDQKRVEVAK